MLAITKARGRERERARGRARRFAVSPTLRFAQEGGGGLFLALLLALGGCAPPGPRSLLEADRLIRQGQYSQAVQRLEAARRYMDRDPRIWHWLGLAYQGAGQPQRAIEAYQNALALDRSNLVFVAHYNLGCLYLEQNNPTAAVNELRSFCLLSNSLPALLKLGQAEWQARQLDAAEKTFGQALRLRPTDPTALNGLGLVYVQRGRTREAAAQFQNALQSDPKHAPALLNMAILYHQQPGSRAYAAQKYHEYLALDPRPAHYEAVRALSLSLDQELAPPPAVATNPESVRGNGAAPPTPRGQAAGGEGERARGREGELAVSPFRPLSDSLSRAIPSQIVTQQSVQVPPTNLVKPAPASTVLTSPEGLRGPGLAARTSAPPSLGPAATSLSSAPPAAVTLVKLPDITPVKTAQDLTPSQTSGSVAPPPEAFPAATDRVWVVSAPQEKPAKKSLLQKLNPFGGRRTTPKAFGAATTTNVSAAAQQPASSQPALFVPPATATPRSNPPPVAPPVVVVPRPPTPRYTYLSPAKPRPGDRQAAEPFFAQGLKAHREKRPQDALLAFRAALDKDPAYYEAYYNVGLLAIQVSDWRAALHACESALAIQPADVPARLAFAHALDQSGYFLDAASELEKVLGAKPDEVRAHLALANLLAQKFQQPDRARPHYEKVLELEPSHPRANEIRYWLASNP